jgi:hypothetical protein
MNESSVDQEVTAKPWHQKGDRYSLNREGLKGVSPSRTLKDKVDMAVFICF